MPAGRNGCRQRLCQPDVVHHRDGADAWIDQGRLLATLGLAQYRGAFGAGVGRRDGADGDVELGRDGLGHADRRAAAVGDDPVRAGLTGGLHGRGDDVREGFTKKLC